MLISEADLAQVLTLTGKPVFVEARTRAADEVIELVRATADAAGRTVAMVDCHHAPTIPAADIYIFDLTLPRSSFAAATAPAEAPLALSMASVAAWLAFAFDDPAFADKTVVLLGPARVHIDHRTFSRSINVVI